MAKYCSKTGKAFTSAFGWKDCELFLEGLILNLLLAGSPFNSFQMDGIERKQNLVKKYINWTFYVNTKEEMRNIFLV